MYVYIHTWVLRGHIISIINYQKYKSNMYLSKHIQVLVNICSLQKQSCCLHIIYSVSLGSVAIMRGFSCDWKARPLLLW